MSKDISQYAPSEQAAIKSLYGAFKILSSLPEGLRIKDLLARMANEIDYTDWEKEILPKTQNIRWQSNFLFYSVDLVKSKYIDKNKGIWKLTDEGIKKYQEGAVELFESTRLLYREWERSSARLVEQLEKKSGKIYSFIQEHADKYSSMRLSTDSVSGWNEAYKWEIIKETRTVFEEEFTALNVINKIQQLDSQKSNLVYFLGNFSDLITAATKHPAEVARLLNELINGEGAVQERAQYFIKETEKLLTFKKAIIGMELVAFILFCADPYKYVPYKGEFVTKTLERFGLSSLLLRKVPSAKYSLFLELCKLVGTYLSTQNILPENEREFELLNGQDFLWVTKESEKDIFNVLQKFVTQSESNDLKFAEYPREFDGFNVQTSFGQGSPARVTWMTFLTGENKTSKGIYVCYLYYKSLKKLVLSLGISEDQVPVSTWPVNTIANLKLISETLPSAERYGDSYVWKTYDVVDGNLKANDVVVNYDLKEALSVYRKVVEDDGSVVIEPLKNDVHYWILDVGQLWDDFVKRSYASIGYDQYELGDLKAYRLQSSIRDTIAASEGVSSISSGFRMNDVLALWEFANVIKVGDIIIAKSGTREMLGYGQVVSEYTFDENKETHKYERGVSWNVIKTVTLKDERLVAKTLTDITQYDGYAQRLLSLFSEEQPIFTIENALQDLFIEELPFREILESLQYKKNIILQGPPGVGKTFFSKRLAYSLIGKKKDENIGIIQFHQSYSYEDFIQGFKPTPEGKFVLKNGVFFEFCRKARQNPDEKYVFIIDEINRGNLSKIFGELMMLIECDKRGRDFAINLTYATENSDTFYVPENVYIIGTMNTADRSLAMVDYALRRRFRFMTLEPLFNNKFEDFLRTRHVTSQVIAKILTSMENLNQQIYQDVTTLGKDFVIGHSYFTPTATIVDSEKWYEGIITNEIAPQLREYYFDNEQKAQELIDLIE